MPHVDFNQYEAEALAHLADHYDSVGQYIDVEDFYQYGERGLDAVMATIQRFCRYELVEMHTRASIEILPQALDVVEQLCGEAKSDPDPKPTVNYNIHGNNARVNVNSIDNSTNQVTVDQSVFTDLREIITSNIENSEQRDELLQLVKELQDSAGTSSFVEKYREFVSSAADHITIFAPAIPALTQMLS